MNYILSTDSKGVVSTSNTRNALAKATKISKELKETVYISYDSGQDGYIDINKVEYKA